MNNYYLTTSIPYVNGEPHIGHALELVIADALARYKREMGENVLFSTGTDEHGAKIEQKAKSENSEPQDFVDRISGEFERLIKELNISNDRFIRTTDPEHEKSVKKIWKKLENDIYKSVYIGWYCTGDEAFFTETEVKENNGICPNHNKPFEKVEEENYFFRLSKYGPKIAELIKSGKFNIVPETRRNEILSFIETGLEDISVSRPKTSTSWGISVPGDAKQTIYVWLDALLNYITVLGYPDGEDFRHFWPARTQIIGKDIIRFHAAIWPAILMSLGLPLPKNLYVHGFISIEGQKMGKSLGNFISPFDLIEAYGVEPLRYYLLKRIPSYADGDYSRSLLKETYDKELANELGNAVQRVATMVERFLGGRLESNVQSEHDDGAYHQAISEYRFDRALEEVWRQVKGINQYIDEEKPWQLAKDEDKEHLEEVLGTMVSGLLQAGRLLKPFMPDTADKIIGIFSSSPIIAPQTPLFPRLD